MFWSRRLEMRESKRTERTWSEQVAKFVTVEDGRGPFPGLSPEMRAHQLELISDRWKWGENELEIKRYPSEPGNHLLPTERALLRNIRGRYFVQIGWTLDDRPQDLYESIERPPPCVVWEYASPEAIMNDEWALHWTRHPMRPMFRPGFKR